MLSIFSVEWKNIWHILIVGIVAYSALLLMLRVSGKRTLSKMNAFDFIGTVAIGSTLASVISDTTKPLSEGLFVLFFLILFQFILEWASTRFNGVHATIKSEPQLLFYRGRMMKGIMKKARLREEDILQAIREEGLGSLNDVDAVILEGNGTLSVVQDVAHKQDESTLKNI